jgi:hypothetical protein
MTHNNLETYYRLIFALCQFHKWSPEFIENMIPYEREIYTTLLNQHLQEEEEKAKQKNK